MPEEKPKEKTVQNEAEKLLYVSDEIHRTKEIGGVIFLVKELDSDEYMSLNESCTDAKGRMLKKKYIRHILFEIS